MRFFWWIFVGFIFVFCFMVRESDAGNCTWTEKRHFGPSYEAFVLEKSFGNQKPQGLFKKDPGLRYLECKGLEYESDCSQKVVVVINDQLKRCDPVRGWRPLDWPICKKLSPEKFVDTYSDKNWKSVSQSDDSVLVYKKVSETGEPVKDYCSYDLTEFKNLASNCRASGGHLNTKHIFGKDIFYKCECQGGRTYNSSTQKCETQSDASQTQQQNANTANSTNQECVEVGKKECRDRNPYYVCKTNEDCAAPNINVPAHASTKKCDPNQRNGYSICIADTCEDDYEPYQGYCKKKEKNETPIVTEPEPQTDDCTKSGGTLGNNDECICNGENLQQSEDKKTCVATTPEPTGEESVIVEPVAEEHVVEIPNKSQCGGGTLNEDGTTCNCDVEGAHLVPTADGSCDCADGYHRDETGVCVENTAGAGDGSTDTTVTSSETTTSGAGNQQQDPKKLEQATEDYKKAKENEQSLANRTLTAASTAATGLGLMTAASAYSEKRADEAAEQDMSAYLSTFRCEYGKGQSTKAGNEEITLPGGNELLGYYSEYKELADNLKNTKKALGMRPGIEQEVVYDKAESGLYKYASTGITDGAFTSLSRALTDTEGKDAVEWNEQKDKSAKKLKGGAIAAGAGVAGGVVGDAVINTDMIQNIKDAFKK